MGIKLVKKQLIKIEEMVKKISEKMGAEKQSKERENWLEKWSKK